MKKKVFSLVVLLVIFAGCKNQDVDNTELPQLNPSIQDASTIVKIETNLGDIIAELYP